MAGQHPEEARVGLVGQGMVGDEASCRQRLVAMGEEPEDLRATGEPVGRERQVSHVIVAHEEVRLLPDDRCEDLHGRVVAVPGEVGMHVRLEGERSPVEEPGGKEAQVVQELAQFGGSAGLDEVVGQLRPQRVPGRERMPALGGPGAIEQHAAGADHPLGMPAPDLVTDLRVQPHAARVRRGEERTVEVVVAGGLDPHGAQPPGPRQQGIGHRGPRREGAQRQVAVQRRLALGHRGRELVQADRQALGHAPPLEVGVGTGAAVGEHVEHAHALALQLSRELADGLGHRPLPLAQAFQRPPEEAEGQRPALGPLVQRFEIPGVHARRGPEQRRGLVPVHPPDLDLDAVENGGAAGGHQPRATRALDQEQLDVLDPPRVVQDQQNLPVGQGVGEGRRRGP